ncbi:MAG: class I SAM-dependent methyltransferase [Chloroflexota bacterium]
MTNPTDPTERFSSRAENYARYRPGYPQAIFNCLRDECGLTAESVIADIGSGTGILTELFLKNGNRVFAVEPNKSMRRESEKLLVDYPKFISVQGRAEATTLSDRSVDFVTAGQAFHWFDGEAARMEFERILRPGGLAVLVWNARVHETDPVMEAYERVLSDFGLGYHGITHRSHKGEIDTLFQNGWECRTFAHSRALDFAALWGGFLSASYAPSPEDAHYESMREGLRRVFDNFQQRGLIDFHYDTHLYFGHLTS